MDCFCFVFLAGQQLIILIQWKTWSMKNQSVPRADSLRLNVVRGAKMFGIVEGKKKKNALFLIHLFGHPVINSFNQSSIQSFIRLFIHPFIQSFVRSFFHSCVHYLIHSFIPIHSLLPSVLPLTLYAFTTRSPQLTDWLIICCVFTSENVK